MKFIISFLAAVLLLIGTAFAAESPNKTVVTSGTASTITDAQTNAWTVPTSNGHVLLNGVAIAATANVSEIAYVNHTVWQLTTGGNWSYFEVSSNGTTAASAATISPNFTISPLNTATNTNFSVSGGYLIDPTGAKFIPVGTNIADYRMNTILQNSSGFPVTTLFPGINYIRIAMCDEGGCAINGSSGGSQPTSITYPAVSNFANIVTFCQDNRIVCDFSDHISNGGFWEGSNLSGGTVPSYPPTGSLLSSATTFWASFATMCKGNPYCWISDINELGIQSYNPSDIARFSPYQLAIYNAVRNTGNNNIINFQAASGAIDHGGTGQNTMGPAGGLVTADYANMTNIIFRIHYYDTDTVSNIVTNAKGAACPNAGSHGYLCQQGVLTKDGKPPIIINEYGGNSGDGTTTDGANVASAMASIQSDGIGSAAWTYNEGGCAEVPAPGTSCRTEVNNGGTTGLTIGTSGNTYYLSTWGTEVKSTIAANPFPGGNGTPQLITAPATLSATTGTAVNVPGLVASDTTYPNDTMTFTGTSSGSGTLSAVGASGNGTGTITYTGSLSGLNSLLGTVTFKDSVVETPTLHFSVYDQHSEIDTKSTGVTVTGGTGGGGGVVPPIVGCNTTTCTGTALPVGYATVAGSQFQVGAGNNVRMACAVYQGAGALADFQAIRAAGFNCVRLDWRDIYVATPSGPPIIALGIGSLTDTAGNVYTIDSAGNAIEAVGGSNPTAMPGGTKTNFAELYNGVIYFDGEGTWYTWNGTGFVAATTPAQIGSIAITAGHGGLADNTFNIYTIGTGPPKATPGVGSFTDSGNNVWTVNASVNNGEAYENNVAPAFSSNVAALYLINNIVYQVNTSNQWYSFTQTGTNAGTWNASATQTPAAGGALEQVGSGSPTAMAGGSGMTQAEFYNGVIYFNSGTNWYTWSGTAFVAATAPPPAGSAGGITPPPGCNSLTQITSCVANAATASLAVVFNHLGNEAPAVGSACLTRQQNGLWFDSGTDSGGSDGCGNTGTVTAAIFQTNTVNLLKAFNNNPTVVGYEFHNEPLVNGTFTGTGTPAIPPVNWGGGGPTDIMAACGTVGAAVNLVNPGVVLFCPGPINNVGTTLLDGVTSKTFAGSATTNFMDLSAVAAHPVTGLPVSKIAYSVHLFPCNVANTAPDSPATAMTSIWNAYFGSLEINGTAPVVNLSTGCSCDNTNGQTADDAAFMTAWVAYANGLATHGPSFTGTQQPIGNAWYLWGNFSGSNPDGILNADGTLKGTEVNQNGGQAFYWSQLLQTSRMQVTTWNPADLLNITLSNNNLTATSTATHPQGVRATTSHASGDYCWAVTASTIEAGWMTGLANGAWAHVDATSNAIEFQPARAVAGQAVWFANALLTSSSGISASGEEMDLCANMNSQLLYVSSPTMVATSGAGSWNNSNTCNPTVASCGLSFSGMTGTFFPFFYDPVGSGGVAVLNTGGPFSNAVLATLPTGYVTWDTALVTNGPRILIFGENDHPANDNSLFAMAQ